MPGLYSSFYYAPLNGGGRRYGGSPFGIPFGYPLSGLNSAFRYSQRGYGQQGGYGGRGGYNPYARNDNFYRQQAIRNPSALLTDYDRFRLSAGAMLRTDTGKAAVGALRNNLLLTPAFQRLSQRDQGTGNRIAGRLAAAMSEAFYLTSETNGSKGINPNDFNNFYKNLQLTMSRARMDDNGNLRAFGPVSERTARRYFDMMHDEANKTFGAMNLASSSTSVDMRVVSRVA